MAGVKDEKSFYKKYPTEAAFLKAHPKAKAQLKKFATGGVSSDYNTYAAGVGMAVNAGMATNDAIQLNDSSNENYRKEDNKDLSGQFGAAGMGAASGALTGATIGSAVPVIGTAIGAVVGGAIGGASGFFKQRSNDKKEWKAEQEAENQQMISQQNAAMYTPQQFQQPQQVQKISSYANPNQQMFGKYGGQIPMAVAKYGGMYNMGGIQQYAMGGFGDPTDPPISAKIINNAQKVSTVPSNYNKIGSQDNRTYYDVASDKAKSNPLGNGTGPNPGWEQSIIKRLQSGTSAQSLADAGHISSSQIEKYNQYYKPVYTETEPVKTEPIPLADENKIDRKQVFSGSPYNTFQYPDATGGYAKATTRYFDPKTNKEIDAFKSFDSEGNYAPLYLNNPSEGIQGTLKQTRINTPINSPVDSIPVNTGNSGFKYGGQMQYAMGGMNVQPNAEVQGGEMITSDTPPQLFNNGGIRLVSNNPYSDPTYETNGPSHDTVNQDGTTGMEVFLPPNTVINGLTKVPAYMANKKGETFDDHMKKHAVKENKIVKLSEQIFKKAQNGDKYSKNTSSLILPILDQKLKEFADYKNHANNVQNAIVANKEQLKAIKRGELPYPSQYNEQMEPQGMPRQSQGEMAIGKHGGMMNYMAMGGIQESDYQTDPGNLPSLLRQKRANDAALLGIRSSFGRNADTTNINDPLVVTLNKSKNFGKELEDKINNHPDNKKIEPFAMGGKLPMYYMGGDNDPDTEPQDHQVFGSSDEYGNYIPQTNDDGYFEQPETPENHTAQRFINKWHENNDGKPLTALQKLNSSIQFPSTTKVDPKINTKGKGFDWANAGKQVGQYALQNAGNIYDLYRSTQDNSKLNLARYSPELLSAEKSFFDNQRTYSEGIRQAAQASGGNASTYLGNLGALRGQKMDADLNTRVQFGNLNAQIANAAKLYNAGAIDKETMFKLQSEGANRDMFASGLKGVSQNIINQQNTNRKFASEDELFKAVKGDFSLYFKVKEAQRLAEEKAKGKLS